MHKEVADPVRSCPGVGMDVCGAVCRTQGRAGGFTKPCHVGPWFDIQASRLVRQWKPPVFGYQALCSAPLAPGSMAALSLFSWF